MSKQNAERPAADFGVGRCRRGLEWPKRSRSRLGQRRRRLLPSRKIAAAEIGDQRGEIVMSASGPYTRRRDENREETSQNALPWGPAHESRDPNSVSNEQSPSYRLGAAVSKQFRQPTRRFLRRPESRREFVRPVQDIQAAEYQAEFSEAAVSSAAIGQAAVGSMR